jgi:DNA adenine methylase
VPENYSPLRYPGGKAQLARFIMGVIKANGWRTPDYAEPYAGGAGAALQLLFEEYVDSITINDADPRIYSFWRAVVEQNSRFVDRLTEVRVSIAEWERQRETYLARDLRRWFDLGFATFYLNRTTRSGIIHNGGPIGGYNQQGNYKIDARFNKAQLIRRIQRIGFYSDRISTSDLDGLALLRSINRNATRAARTLAYLDPPYYQKSTHLYLNKFTHRQHAALAHYLSAPRNFPWLLTYDSVEEIRALYGSFSQVPFHLSYSAYERRTGEEVLIHPPWVLVPETAKAALPALAS